MRTAPSCARPLGGELRAVGVVAASERGLAQINTRFAGWIQKLLVSETGERVKRGQVLATIYSPDVLARQQELLTARAGRRRRRLAPRRRRRRLPLPRTAREPDVGHGRRRAPAPRAARDRAAGDRRGPAHAARRARRRHPLAGRRLRGRQERRRRRLRAARRRAVRGRRSLAPSGSSPTSTSTTSRASASARRRASSWRRFPGAAVTRARSSSSTRSVEPGDADAARPASSSRNRHGPSCAPACTATCYLDLPGAPALMVPAEAVVDTGEPQYLFVAEGGRPLRAAPGQGRRARRRTHVEILSGVAEGETVVTTGNFLVDSESRLRAAIEGQTSGRAPARARTQSIDGRENHRVLRPQPAAGAARASAVARWSSARLVAIRRIKLDAIPDLSDPQVIVFTEWMGRSPTLVEDQVTYPIVSTLIGDAARHRRARLLDVRDVVRLRRSSRRAPTSTGRAAACSST